VLFLIPLVQNTFLTMKILSIICGFLFFLLFSSCDNGNKSGYVIGVSQCSDDLWRQTMNNEMLREASFNKDISLKIKTVKDDTKQQIKDIESLIDAKVDLLIISPNESTAMTPIVQKAYKAGIPVILVDRKIDTDDYTAYIGADNYQIGKEAGLYAAGVLNGKGNIVEIRGWNGSTSDAERHAGFIDGLKNYSDIHIIAEKRGDYLKVEAEKQMIDILKEHDRIDLVFALNDPMAVGVHEAVSKYSGKLPFIIGVDALAGEGGGIENIQRGLQDASFIYPTGGDKVIDLAVNILNHKHFNRENILYTAVVDKSNYRVLQLQMEQIVEHQQKLEKMNNLLNESLIQYSNQRTLFYGTILVLLLISILLFVSIIAYRSKSKSNRLLEEQKNQLVSLSQQLEEATHAKLVFFTNISHEFRTPLALILGPVETLQASENLSSEQKNLLDIIRRNSNSLLNLISQIIEFRSFENGKMNTFFAHDDIKLFLEDLNTSFSDYSKRRNVDFQFEYTDDLFQMSFDKEKVEKIYFNLLSNAFKNTEKGGFIKISLSKERDNNKDYAKILVFNNGKAIPKDKINNIFNRFYKVNPNDSGTGIGLALVSALVEVHQGKISVESIEGEGTTFCVLLPFQQDNSEGISASFYEAGYIQNQMAVVAENKIMNEVLNEISDENKPIILLIEDNPDMRNYMRMFLESDYEVIEADDGSSGIEKTIKYIPDIIICDVMMPEKDGFEVCQILKKNILTSHIPIVLLTACSLDEQKAIGFESGADAYIPKPFNANILKIRIRKLIESRQMLKETFSNSFIKENKKSSFAKIEQDFIDTFRKHVTENISNPDLNIDGIAKQQNLSRVQLYRKIKSLSGYSPNELVRIIRLKHAAQLLSSGLSISEIAYQSGFSSASYFTKCFKEFYKMSPTDYLKS
jgi:signal transduction histidine kinase/DNA-binding response OmpR family regulator